MDYSEAVKFLRQIYDDPGIMEVVDRAERTQQEAPRFTAYETNILNGVADWLETRSTMVWAKDSYSGLMVAWSKELRDILARTTSAANSTAPMQPSDLDDRLQRSFVELGLIRPIHGSPDPTNISKTLSRARGAIYAAQQALAAPTQASMQPSVTIDFSQAAELLAMFGGEPTEITLMTGDGHSGNGLYAVYNADLEGSVFLGETDEDAIPAAPAAAVGPTMTEHGEFHGTCTKRSLYGPGGLLEGQKIGGAAAAPDATTTEERTVLDDILDERKRQDVQWGGPKHDDEHDDSDWCEYLDYQMTQIISLRGVPRDRFVKIAALSIAAIESIDRKDGIGDQP